MHSYTFELLSRSGRQEEWTAFLELMQKMPPVSEAGPWLCGGALRRLIAGQALDSDFDYFFSNAEQIEAFEAWMKTHGATISYQNDFNTTWKLGERIVQQITIQQYQSVGDVLDSFDFTICQFGFDGTKITTGEYSLWDLAKRRLSIHRLTYGVSTLRRLMKYSRQGYAVCGGVLADILQRTIEQPDTINSKVVSLD